MGLLCNRKGNEKESFIVKLKRLISLDYEVVSNHTKTIKNKKNIEIVGKCPKCGNDVIEINNYYSCLGIHDDTCKYKKPNSFNGEYLSYEEILKCAKYKEMISAGFFDDEKEKSIKDSLSTINENISGESITTENTEDKSSSEEISKNDSVLGLCPKCKSDVIENNNSYSCTKCNYSLKKFFSKTVIEPKEIKLLLEKKPTNLIQFTDKNGKTYNSRLTLDEKNYYYAFASNEKNKDKDKEEKHKIIAEKCPLCNKDLIVGKTSYGCIGNKEKTCTFKIPFKYKGMITITESDANNLIRKRTITKIVDGNDVYLSLYNNSIEEVPF